jgi:hypothetical protein
MLLAHQESLYADEPPAAKARSSEKNATAIA